MPREKSTRAAFEAAGAPIVTTRGGANTVHPNALNWRSINANLDIAQISGGSRRDQVHAHPAQGGGYVAHQIQDSLGKHPGFVRQLSQATLAKINSE